MPSLVMSLLMVAKRPPWKPPLAESSTQVTDETTSDSYAFNVTHHHDQPFLTNRRLFAFADVGVPDGVKCDMTCHVYSGCDDGINVWSPGGVLLGRFLGDKGAANFCFGRAGELFILNEHRLWRAQLDSSIKGALLRI